MAGVYIGLTKLIALSHSALSKISKKLTR